MRMQQKIAVLVLACLWVSGCASRSKALDPALSPSAVAVPKAFALAAQGEVLERSALATLLPQEDPAFMALRQAVEADPPTLAAAQARIDAARALARSASANRKPTLSADAAVSGVRNRFENFTQDNVNFGANITASWDADLFGGLRDRERAARIRIDAASADAAAVRLGLVATLAANVVDWRTLQAREQILLEDIAAAQNLKELTRLRASAGLAPELDSVQAQALIVEAQAQLAALPAERAAIIGALVALTGAEAARITTSLNQDFAPSITPKALASTPAQLLRARPDILAAEARLAAADADIAVAAANRFPRLTLSSALGLLSFALGDVLSEEALVGNLGAGLAGPLLDFGRVAAQIDQSKANAREAFANYRTLVFNALGETETVYGQIEAIDKEYAILIQREALEKDAEYLLNIRYRNGLSDFRDVLSARRVLNATRTQAAIANGRALRARITLWQALGGS